MSLNKTQNIGHSVFEQLSSYAKNQSEELNYVLTRYGAERLLYRISVSEYSDKFVLKGASLFLVWTGRSHRITKDIDFLIYGSPDIDYLKSLFKEICELPSEKIDGIKFYPESIKAVPIREVQEYGGIRITLKGKLHNAQIHVQIDVGFGDIVTPQPEFAEYPTILNIPAPKILVYSPYTLISEKFEAMLHLGIANSRMKDFYDIWLLSQSKSFQGDLLSKAISNTFRCRSTPLPTGLPVVFTNEFYEDTNKKKEWKAFIGKFKPDNPPEIFKEVIQKIESFLMPIVDAVRKDKLLHSNWKDGGPWL